MLVHIDLIEEMACLLHLLLGSLAQSFGFPLIFVALMLFQYIGLVLLHRSFLIRQALLTHSFISVFVGEAPLDEVWVSRILEALHCCSVELYLE